MFRVSRQDFIIITGSGKKVGKTCLAVDLINHFSVQTPLVALKISPHSHDALGRVNLVAVGTGYRIFRELDVHGKNSGQYLKAGALTSFFMETEDEILEIALRHFLSDCNSAGYPVICESGALGLIVQPGILFFIDAGNSVMSGVKLAQKDIADLILPAKNFNGASVVNRVELVNGHWSLLPGP